MHVKWSRRISQFGFVFRHFRALVSISFSLRRAFPPPPPSLAKTGGCVEADQQTATTILSSSACVDLFVRPSVRLSASPIDWLAGWLPA